MTPTTDTPRTDAVPSTQSMLTAQSDPVKLYQQLCKVTVDFGKALDACVDYQNQLAASKAEVERLKRLLSDLLILTEKNYWNSTNYKQIKEAINPTNK
jgi:hypothetical protein